MFALVRLFAAFTTLAVRLEALAGTVGTVDEQLQERIGLHEPAPAIEGPPVEALPRSKRGSRER